MSTCPYCYSAIPGGEITVRCTGQCQPVPDPQGTALAGYETRTTPFYRIVQNEDEPVRTTVPCRRCGQPCQQRICNVCHRDLPPGWEDARVFTMTLVGARGSGKSVYIAVAVDLLRRYAQSRGCTMTPTTTGTYEVYSQRYYKPLFKENVVMEGTPPIAGGGAYQQDPLIWEFRGNDIERFYIVMRDVAGEDIEKVVGKPLHFSFMDRADLVVFLFDPLMLDSVRQVLAGIIPEIDRNRLGDMPGEVLPKVLLQLSSGSARLALTISKFDSLHKMTDADSALTPLLANPAAHFNRDDTMLRARQDIDSAMTAFENDVVFLDAEVRSLFNRIGDDSVTLSADSAQQNGALAEVRHFAVSAVGESPQHADQLTERGISPFRVLDPILWGLHRVGLRF
ncbi:hypothetical protein [Actinomyces sp. 565]|uniref:hypothetical protein n=1 Tax=Actinomyces sp. 565 TaxID=2057794 RepID=UPI0013A6C7A2|nr:hypothetical protein [Actinomyces sp. 565]NDR53418.1 hypothetical protein [Actinomyces sp. 565]